MKKTLLSLLFLPSVLMASVDMTRINASLFINNPETDFGKILVDNPVLKRKLVLSLFDRDMLNHELTKAFSTDATFETYFQAFEEKYMLIDMDRDGDPELVFSGLVSADDEREHLEVYAGENKSLTKIYDELGHLLAFKTQPNTGEILLYHHQYPCCLNASHNINRLRKVNTGLQLQKRYFAAREAGDMKGDFFPDKTHFSGKFRQTKKTMSLYWSGEKIDKEAWSRRVQENVIARFEKGAVYTVLAEEKGWFYVLIYTPPIIENNVVINPSNFKDTKLFGWLKKSEI